MSRVVGGVEVEEAVVVGWETDDILLKFRG